MPGFSLPVSLAARPRPEAFVVGPPGTADAQATFLFDLRAYDRNVSAG
jgi:hypothetical protein